MFYNSPTALLLPFSLFFLVTLIYYFLWSLILFVWDVFLSPKRYIWRKKDTLFLFPTARTDKKSEPGVFWNLPWRHDCNLVSLFTTRYRVGVKGQHEFIYAILLLLLFASRNNLFYTHSFIHEKKLPKSTLLKSETNAGKTFPKSYSNWKENEVSNTE